MTAKIANLLADDINKVTGHRPNVGNKTSSYCIIVGTLGHSSLINRLEESEKIDASPIKGGWEQYLVRLVDNPLPGVKQALVICGSDRRGTAYGMFAVSEAIGVSPLYWWSDVSVEKQRNLAIESANVVSVTPAVRYRGIFINDEGWGITPWAGKTFDTKLGDIGPKTYDKVCEFILRMRGNMLAPAMHPSSGAFNKYPENKKVADSWGIIMSSSHCEPLLFNNVTEWDEEENGAWKQKHLFFARQGLPA